MARDVGTRRAVVTRHRGRLQGRDGAVAVVQDGDIRAGRAAVGGLPGLRHPRSGRIRHRLSVHRRDRGAASARAEARARAGGLGLHERRRQGSLASDGRLQGGRRDGERVLPGHARPRLGRSAARDLGRRAGHHQGDRDLLPALGAPALPGAQDAQPGGQGPGRRLARVQGPRDGLLSGAFTRHRARPGRGRGRRLRDRAAQCGPPASWTTSRPASPT